ncbi:hypothetical protein [Brevundimonas sp. LjRoot202]|uniref:hypothetical protein n=1 Tax=Brevundimonas sp. LjRoot202 TaxID=3342281 RepID=UPI003ED14CBB
MTVIAHLSKARTYSGFIFLGGSALYILMQPLWHPGGLRALMAGDDGGRGWWPIPAIAALVLLPMMVRALFRTLRHRGPAVFIRDGALYCAEWRAPVALSDIRALAISRFGILSRSQPMVTLTTLDGSVRRIQTLNLTPDTAEIGRRIAEAVGLPAPASATVTTP